MANQTRLLHHWLIVIEDHEVWDALHIEPGRHFRMTFRIELYDYSSSRHIRGGARNLWHGHSAWPALGSPEIHQHGNAGILNYFVERLRIDFQRLVHRGHRSFAGTAPSSIGKMYRWNAVLLPTSLAGSNCGHIYVSLLSAPCDNRFIDCPRYARADRNFNTRIGGRSAETTEVFPVLCEHSSIRR